MKSAVLAQVEGRAYAVLDAYFSDTGPNHRGGGMGKMRNASAAQYHRAFTRQLGGAEACDAVAVGPPVPNPHDVFAPPVTAPTGYAPPLDVTLPELALQAYNRYEYPLHRAN